MKRRRTRALLTAFTILASSLPESRGLEVLSIEGPGVVVNGSSSQLVLDCIYDLTEYDKASLVVKWYYNRQPYPVYQWIPHNKPQDLGRLKGRVNLQHTVTQDAHTKHRALAILAPTTDLTGEYTCWISSFEKEDFKRKEVIVYAPARDMTLGYSKPSADRVLVRCQAGRLYPAPTIAIWRSGGSSAGRRVMLDGARVDSRHFADLGYFNISIELEALDFELDSETMFECVLTIPDTEYKLQEKIVYFPGAAGVTAPAAVSGNGGVTVGSGNVALLALLLLLLHCCVA